MSEETPEEFLTQIPILADGFVKWGKNSFNIDFDYSAASLEKLDLLADNEDIHKLPPDSLERVMNFGGKGN